MAVPNIDNPSRPLKSDLSMALKIFAGEVLTTFEGATVILDKHFVKTIQHGRTAQFPATGVTTAGYHTPGAYLTPSAILSDERTITIDGLLLASCFVADIDEAMSHYETRSIYSNELGVALAQAFDKNVFNEIVLGARASGLVGQPGGVSVIDANLNSATLSTKAEAITKALFSIAASWDANNVPASPRYACFKPAEYYALVQAVQTNGFSVIHKDYNGRGSLATGKIMELAGFNILMSNNVPSSDMSGWSYHGVDASTVKGIAWTPQAAATVKLMSLSVQQEYSTWHQGTVLVARYAMGHGYLRPACCAEMKTA